MALFLKILQHMAPPELLVGGRRQGPKENGNEPKHIDLQTCRQDLGCICIRYFNLNVKNTKPCAYIEKSLGSSQTVQDQKL